ncbi:MAG: ribosome recycling factor [Oscillospiraceae bacterium]
MTKVYEDKMAQAVRHLESEYGSIRAGRATPTVLEKIMVDYYGTPTPINQMAAISITEARTLSIQPWDRSTLSTISKAIQASDLGINPTDDGSAIRLVFPSPTEERRKVIVKDVSKMAEEAKIAVRNVRRDAIDKFKAAKKASEITEDDLKNLEEKMQKITDKFIKEIDDVANKKTKEVMEL